MAKSRRITSSDFFTRANAITLVGGLLTFIGALQLNTVKGLLFVVLGRSLDVVDGWVARRTHWSHFGAVFDATTDKIVGLALLIAAFHFKLVPVLFILLVFIYHLAISIINIGVETRGTTYTSTSASGKQTMLCHVVSIVLFVASIHFADPVRGWIYAFAVFFMVISIWYAQKSITGYIKEYRKTL